jgi:single-stranded-DNA-specific exonuclease
MQEATKDKLSIRKRNWRIKDTDEAKQRAISRNYSLPEIISRILAQKPMEIGEIEAFLDPKIKHNLPNPSDMLDMDKGVARILKALQNSEKVVVFGDYDVDGVTSSALFKKFFAGLGKELEIYIPDRFVDGYGPSSKAFEKLRQNGAEVIITVDSGSVAFEAIDYISQKGVDVIVLDHHLTAETMPAAKAVINPNRLDENFPHKNLAAVGVSFLFLVALSKSLRQTEDTTLTPPNLLEYLDLVALGTVCDVMELTGLNRALVSTGLQVMQKRTNPGLKQILDYLEVEEPPSTYHLGYMIGPRINAGGRIATASAGTELLTTNSTRRAAQLVEELEAHNNERKELENQILEEADNLASQQQHNPVILVSGENWHQGVVGIISSRLKEKYNKPVAAVAINEGEGKASCRSIAGIDFGRIVVEARLAGHLVAGGGHAMAAGFTVAPEKINDLHKFFLEEFGRAYEKLEDISKYYYNGELSLRSINTDLYNNLKALEPFGTGNPEPIFKISDVYVLKASIVGEKHVSCLLASDKYSGISSSAVKAIAFNATSHGLDEVLLSKTPQKLSIIGRLSSNTWKGRQNIQIQISDIIME